MSTQVYLHKILLRYIPSLIATFTFALAIFPQNGYAMDADCAGHISGSADREATDLFSTFEVLQKSGACSNEPWACGFNVYINLAQAIRWRRGLPLLDPFATFRSLRRKYPDLLQNGVPLKRLVMLMQTEGLLPIGTQISITDTRDKDGQQHIQMGVPALPERKYEIFKIIEVNRWASKMALVSNKPPADGFGHYMILSKANDGTLGLVDSTIPMGKIQITQIEPFTGFSIDTFIFKIDPRLDEIYLVSGEAIVYVPHDARTVVP